MPGHLLAGLVVGLGLAALAFRAFSGPLGDLLHGVEPTDPAILGVPVAVLLAAAVLASWLPARRASRTDPAVSPREE